MHSLKEHMKDILCYSKGYEEPLNDLIQEITYLSLIKDYMATMRSIWREVRVVLRTGRGLIQWSCRLGC